MPSISLSRLLFGAAVSAALGAASGCNDPLALPPATAPNVIDTVTLFALRGTPIPSPSAYSIVTRTTARTDRGEPFDFAVDIAATGAALIYPPGALGLLPDAGVLASRVPFDSVVSAPTSGYATDSVVTVTPGTVFVGRSRATPVACTFGAALPRYGKFRVLAIDPQNRSLRLEALVNTNCGYRGLEPGLPTS